ncbi:hypothetical protein VaNZ11_012789 [Volvox africanus]|uniref:Protein kinase domain-containing protein n=1 Tax=Volvox africanus TaxID=51714 RepID=A0ABQ5SEQ9_9CHLO|nr:hypothetical protein VaNZ11_012789 [Volvox africanus]
MSSTKGTSGFLKKLRLLFHIKSSDKQGDTNNADLQATEPVKVDGCRSAVVSKQSLKLFAFEKQGDNQPPIPEEDNKPQSSILSNLIPPRRRLRAILGAASDGHLERRPIGAPSQINSSFVISLSIDLDMSPISSECTASTVTFGDSPMAILAPLPNKKAIEVVRKSVMAPPREVMFNSNKVAADVVARSEHPTQLPPSTLLLTMSAATPAQMLRQSWSLRDYQINRRIYRGNVCSVYQATCLYSFHLVALKVYFMPRVPANAHHMLAREIAIHSDLDHPNIIKLYGAFQEADRLVIVQEFAPRRDLYAQIHSGHSSSSRTSRMDSEQAHDLVMSPLLDALAYLHSRGICHRDIKPENLFFDMDWKLKVGDFGVSINIREERAVTRAGTLEYMAPEVLRCPLKLRMEDNKDNVFLSYTTAVDVWAVGVLAYELLTGILPFTKGADLTFAASLGPVAHAAAAAAAAAQHPLPQLQPASGLLAAPGGTSSARGGGSGGDKSPGYPLIALSFPASVPEDARDFILNAMVLDPNARPTIAELLLHRWMRQGL